MAGAPDIRLFHVSDFHLQRALSPGSGPRSRTERVILAAAVQTAADLHEQEGLHAILISGDLANSGDVRDLTVAKLVAEAVPHSGTKSGRGVGVPTWQAAGLPGKSGGVLVVPGDHDRYGDPPDNTRIDQMSHVNEKLRAVWPGPPSHVCKPIYLPLNGDRKKIAVVRADFTVDAAGDIPESVEYWQKGLVSDPRLERLERMTTEAQKENMPVIWMFHFAPAFPDIQPTMELQGQWRLLGKARELAVPWILSGHTHKCQVYGHERLDNPKITAAAEEFYPGIHCAGSACRLRNNEPPPSTHLLEFWVDGPLVTKATVTTWRWLRARGFKNRTVQSYTFDRQRDVFRKEGSYRLPRP